MSDLQAVNAAIAKSYAQLGSGKPVSIPVVVENPESAVGLVYDLGLEAEVVDDTTIAILGNGAVPAAAASSLRQPALERSVGRPVVRRSQPVQTALSVPQVGVGGLKDADPHTRPVRRTAAPRPAQSQPWPRFWALWLALACWIVAAIAGHGDAPVMKIGAEIAVIGSLPLVVKIVRAF